MNAGNVAAFGCGRSHPQLGDAAVCVRQRHHGGDHRTEHEGHLKVWDDSIAPWDVPRVRELVDHDGDPLPVDTFGDRGGRVHHDPIPGELDEVGETWLEASGRGGEPLVDAVTRILVLALLVGAVAAMPALLALLYRQL